jgi:hypothetical protein
MLPTLRDGDRLLVRWGARPVAGRVAVVRLPGGRPVSVKRLAFPRDGGWWIERDNPDVGTDSWLVGALPPQDVLGLVLLRYRPVRRLGRVRRLPAP